MLSLSSSNKGVEKFTLTDLTYDNDNDHAMKNKKYYNTCGWKLKLT